MTPEAGEATTNAGSRTPCWDSDEPLAKSRPGGGNGMDRDAPLPAKLDAEPQMTDSSEFSAEFEALKTSLHRKLLERLNLSSLGERNRDEAEEEVAKLVRHMLAQENTPLNMEEREKVVEQLVYEIFGLGPQEPLLKDPTISDILVNGCDSVYIERDGRLQRTNVSFKNNQHLLQVIDRIVSAVGRRIDESSPMVDARLKDGSRVNAIIPPLALDGPSVSIRKFRRDVLSAEDLLRAMDR